MNNQKRRRKPLGRGSICLPISIFASSLSFTYIREDGKSLGEAFFSQFTPYHIEYLVTIVLCIVSILISNKYPEFMFSNIGKWWAILILGSFIISMLLRLIVNGGM